MTLSVSAAAATFKFAPDPFHYFCLLNDKQIHRGICSSSIQLARHQHSLNLPHNRQVFTRLHRYDPSLTSFLEKTGWTIPRKFLPWFIINTFSIVHLSGSGPFASRKTGTSASGSWIEDSSPTLLSPSWPRIPPHQPSACELSNACEQKLLSDPQDDRVTLSRHRGCVNVWFGMWDWAVEDTGCGPGAAAWRRAALKVNQGAIWTETKPLFCAARFGVTSSFLIKKVMLLLVAPPPPPHVLISESPLYKWFNMRQKSRFGEVTTEGLDYSIFLKTLSRKKHNRDEDVYGFISQFRTVELVWFGTIGDQVSVTPWEG